jgi:ankyrin repeat protein
MALGGQSTRMGQLCFAQQECGEWLVNNGAINVLPALWDLKLVEKSREMLNADLGCVNEKHGRSGATLLHFAVLRNQPELARLLLAAHPDLTITDDEAHSTPLGWAYYFQRHEIAELIEQQTN